MNKCKIYIYIYENKERVGGGCILIGPHEIRLVQILLCDPKQNINIKTIYTVTQHTSP